MAKPIKGGREFRATTDSSGFQGKTWWREGDIATVHEHEYSDPALIHFEPMDNEPHPLDAAREAHLQLMEKIASEGSFMDSPATQALLKENQKLMAEIAALKARSVKVEEKQEEAKPEPAADSSTSDVITMSEMNQKRQDNKPKTGMAAPRPSGINKPTK